MLSISHLFGCHCHPVACTSLSHVRKQINWDPQIGRAFNGQNWNAKSRSGGSQSWWSGWFTIVTLHWNLNDGFFGHLNRCQRSMRRDHWMASKGGRSVEMKVRSKMFTVPLGTPRPISNCSSASSLSFFLGFCKTLHYLLSNPDGVLWLTIGIMLFSTCATVAAAGGPRRLKGPHLTLSHTDHHFTWESTAVLEGNPTVLTTRNLIMYITVL